MRWMLLMGLAVGCNGATPADCPAVDADTCAATEGCATIQGYALGLVGTDGFCEDDQADAEVVGCKSSELDCPAVEVYGQAGDDATAYRVPAGCLPDGWTSIEGPFPACE
ncbi:MAG: hypothetical protein H6737_04925 [Alphaproteobacteria bacterium]|nr:hypothetical protein [Alphaproteobacteria bacterium]